MSCLLDNLLTEEFILDPNKQLPMPAAAIYVDSLLDHGWKLYNVPVRNCHLFTDGPIEQLHAFADRMGIPRKWFQDERIPHYDLTPARRRHAIACGAIELDRRQTVAMWARIQQRSQDAIDRQSKEWAAWYQKTYGRPESTNG